MFYNNYSYQHAESPYGSPYYYSTPTVPSPHFNGYTQTAQFQTQPPLTNFIILDVDPKNNAPSTYSSKSKPGFKSALKQIQANSASKSTSTSDLARSKLNKTTQTPEQISLNKLTKSIKATQQLNNIGRKLENLDENVQKKFYPPSPSTYTESSLSNTTSSNISTPNTTTVTSYSNGTTSNIGPRVKFLGVERCDPVAYKSKYASSLISPNKLPQYLNKIIHAQYKQANSDSVSYATQHQKIVSQRNDVQNKKADLKNSCFVKTLYRFNSKGQIYKVA